MPACHEISAVWTYRSLVSEMGLMRIMSWYPNFNRSHFCLPPSEIHRITGLGGKFLWTMTYSHRPYSVLLEQRLPLTSTVLNWRTKYGKGIRSLNDGFENLSEEDWFWKQITFATTNVVFWKWRNVSLIISVFFHITVLFDREYYWEYMTEG